MRRQTAKRTSSTFRDRYGPWAVVTGASDGIGRAFAIALAEKGLSVLLTARRSERLEEVRRQIVERGGEARVLELDLRTPDVVDSMEAATRDLDVGLLVAAAGYGTSGPLVEASRQNELEMIDVNCRSVAALAQSFGHRFAVRGTGGLVLMSSLFAFQGVPGSANYAATKAYVQVLAEGLRIELAPSGVDVIASAPGPIASGFAARADLKMSFSQTPEVVAKATLAALGHRTTVRPGWLAKVLETSLATLPRWARTRIMAQVMATMTKHHAHGQVEAAQKAA